MNDEYTPLTENVRLGYAYRERRPEGDKHHPGLLAEFDRWLAEHDRQIAEKAWWEGAEDERLNGSPVNPYYAPTEQEGAE